VWKRYSATEHRDSHANAKGLFDRSSVRVREHAAVWGVAGATRKPPVGGTLKKEGKEIKTEWGAPYGARYPLMGELHGGRQTPYQRVGGTGWAHAGAGSALEQAKTHKVKLDPTKRDPK